MPVSLKVYLCSLVAAIVGILTGLVFFIQRGRGIEPVDSILVTVSLVLFALATILLILAVFLKSRESRQSGDDNH
jgi:hypothetical protein